MIDNQMVFYSRCKPQDCDAIELVLRHKRIFIGWPMARPGVNYDPGNLRSCVVDPSCEAEEWSKALAALARHHSRYNQNRNLVSRVGIGSIALIPRPALGVIYCGRIASNFELVNNPPWYQEYMEIRDKAHLGNEDSKETWHAADVAQCWSLDELKPIPVPRIPAWIRRSLFGRSTYGVIHPDEISGDPYETLGKVLDGDGFQTRLWTLSMVDVEKRLLEAITPSTFEHLVVSLLQLEHPNEVWSQVGGSGDGGIDGIGSDQNGQVAGIVQCKWQYWGGDTFPANPVWKAGSQPFRKYLASLRYPEGVKPLGCEFLDRRNIAELVLKHADRLPEAISLRIGREPSATAGDDRTFPPLVTEG